MCISLIHQLDHYYSCIGLLFYFFFLLSLYFHFVQFIFFLFVCNIISYHAFKLLTQTYIYITWKREHMSQVFFSFFVRQNRQKMKNNKTKQKSGNEWFENVHRGSSKWCPCQICWRDHFLFGSFDGEIDEAFFFLLGWQKLQHIKMMMTMLKCNIMAYILNIHNMNLNNVNLKKNSM